MNIKQAEEIETILNQIRLSGTLPDKIRKAYDEQNYEDVANMALELAVIVKSHWESKLSNFKEKP